MADLNPYAAPQSLGDVIPTSSGRREGKIVVIPVGTDLPHRCIKCNAPAVTPIKKRNISWHHPAWYLLFFFNLIIYLIAASIASKRAKVSPGLCNEHKNARGKWLLMGWLGFFASIALTSVGFSYDYPAFGGLGVLFILVAIIVLIVKSRLVYPSKITKDEIYLKGCGENFLASLPR